VQSSKPKLIRDVDFSLLHLDNTVYTVLFYPVQIVQDRAAPATLANFLNIVYTQSASRPGYGT
jgi:hypothetical protein